MRATGRPAHLWGMNCSVISEIPTSCLRGPNSAQPAPALLPVLRADPTQYHSPHWPPEWSCCLGYHVGNCECRLAWSGVRAGISPGTRYLGGVVHSPARALYSMVNSAPLGSGQESPAWGCQTEAPRMAVSTSGCFSFPFAFNYINNVCLLKKDCEIIQ